MVYVFDVYLKNHHFQGYLGFSLCCLVIYFFHFTFRSVIRFELIFVKDVMSVSRFTFVHADVQLSQDHLLKRLFSIVLHFVLFKDQLTVFMWVYFWAFCCVPLIYFPILLPILHYVDYLALYKFKSWVVSSLWVFSSLYYIGKDFFNLIKYRLRIVFQIYFIF